MRLLVVTQVVDQRDLQLSFFHRWLEELAARTEHVVVICLKEGEHHLPPNVSVYSLGKEGGRKSRAAYAARFLSLVWHLRNEYDIVFVHMNQEYVLLAGKLWWVLRKPVYMWYNHYNGSWLTDLAAIYCRKIFCTSHFAYTAKYKKTVFMPVGVDTKRFSLEPSLQQPRSILFFSRIAPSKRAEVFIDALALLAQKDISCSASIYGSPLPKDEGYYLSLKKRVEAQNVPNVTFHPGIPNDQAPEVFRAREISVNCSRSGMFDKTLFEAAACGCLVVTSIEDFKTMAGDEYYFDGTPEALAQRLENFLSLPAPGKVSMQQPLAKIVDENSLDRLADRLVAELSGK